MSDQTDNATEAKSADSIDPNIIMAETLKDLIDVLKTRTLFLIPFIAPFLAFIFNRPELIIASLHVVQVVIAITFAIAVMYCLSFLRLLSAAQAVHLSVSMNIRTKGKYFEDMTSDLSKQYNLLKSNLAHAMALEAKLYKTLMLALLSTSVAVLASLYYSADLKELAAWLRPHLPNYVAWLF